MPRRRKSRIAKPQPGARPSGDDIATRLVEDPYDPDNLIAVPVNLRHDPLQRMFIRREIDDAQFKAGGMLRHAHEILASRGLKAIDPANETVDAGRSSAGLGETTLRAGERLRQAQTLLGWQSYRLVICVIIDGVNGSTISDATSAKVDRNAVQFQFRSALENLAVLWGFVQDPARVKRQASIVGMVRQRSTWDHEERDITIRYTSES
jgi:hypothetical protein